MGQKRIYFCLFVCLFVFITPCLGDTKDTIIQMTTTLENSNTELQYNYAENLQDGRGITFGCIGFCTGTYDGNIIIKYYTKLNGKNVLSKYINPLNKIDTGKHNRAGGDGNPSTTELNGFIKDVNNCNDPLFKQAQLYELDQLYYNPATKMFNSIGAKNPLTLAFIYDMCVRHGPDDTLKLINLAGKTPKQGVNETTYLTKLISIRDAKLKRENVGDINRDIGFKKLLKSENVNLKTPFTFIAYNEKFKINGDIGV